MNTVCIFSHDCPKFITAQIIVQLTDMTDDHIRPAEIAFTAHLLHRMHAYIQHITTCGTAECGMG